MSSAYDLVIFDLDGTLIDSVGDIADALNAALGEEGLPTYNDRQVSMMVGSGVRELVRRGLRVAEHPEREARVPALTARVRDHYRRQPLQRTSLYFGVREALARIEVAKAIATNKPGELARVIVRGLGLEREFVAVVGEDDVGAAKPDPLMVDIVRGKVGAARARTLYVGDSLVDADTAERARVDLALVTYGYADAAQIRARRAKFHLERLSELPPLLAPPELTPR